jgi:hypothetical protein
MNARQDRKFTAPASYSEGPGSILDPETSYSEWTFRGFLQCLQENAGIVP